VAIAYYGAYRLRFDEQRLEPNFPFFYRSLPLVMAAQMLALFFVGMYRTVWRRVGFAEVLSVAKGTLLGMFSAELLILHIYRFESYSRALFAIYAVLLAIMLMASHAFFALMSDLLERSGRPSTSLRVAISSPRWFKKRSG
jgi:FlaA1/EpsC-like NDP-sugar epimerase